MEGAAPEPHNERGTTSAEPGHSRASSPPLPEISGRPLRIAADPHTNTDDVWARVLAAMSEIAKACAADEAHLNEGWALLHQATERCRLLDQRMAERRKQARKEVEEIHASMADEAEEVLARARASARDVLARAHNEAVEIVSVARQRIHSTVRPPNLALAEEEAKRAAQHFLDQAKTNVDGLLPVGVAWTVRGPLSGR
jgi:hypothetical protein